MVWANVNFRVGRYVLDLCPDLMTFEPSKMCFYMIYICIWSDAWKKCTIHTVKNSTPFNYTFRENTRLKHRSAFIDHGSSRTIWKPGITKCLFYFSLSVPIIHYSWRGWDPVKPVKPCQQPPPPQYFNTDRSKAVLLLWWFLTVICLCCPYLYFGSAIMLVTYFSKF